MERRRFIGGAFAAGAAAALGWNFGIRGGDGEDGPTDPDVIAGAVEEARLRTLNDDTPPPEFDAVDQPKPIYGAAASFIGVTLGPKVFELAGDREALGSHMALAARYGNTVSLPLNGEHRNWSALDAIMAAASGQKLGVVGTVLSKSITSQQVGSYTGALAERYGAGNGGPLGILEIDQRPNLVSAAGTEPNPADYARYFIAAAEGAKNANGGVGVISGGLAPVAETGDRSQITPVKFTDEFLTALLDIDPQHATLLAGVALQPLVQGPETPNIQAEALAQVLSAHNLGDRQVYLTSFGAHTEGPGAITLQDHADLVSQYLTVATEGAKAIRLVDTLIDSEQVDPNNPVNRSGILDTTGAEKLAGTAMREIYSGAERGPS